MQDYHLWTELHCVSTVYPTHTLQGKVLGVRHCCLCDVVQCFNEAVAQFSAVKWSLRL